MVACVTVTSCVNFLLLLGSTSPGLFSESWRALFLPCPWPAPAFVLDLFVWDWFFGMSRGIPGLDQSAAAALWPPSRGWRIAARDRAEVSGEELDLGGDGALGVVALVEVEVVERVAVDLAAFAEAGGRLVDDLRR